jgi:hypothetical protein
MRQEKRKRELTIQEGGNLKVFNKIHILLGLDHTKLQRTGVNIAARNSGMPFYFGGSHS